MDVIEILLVEDSPTDVELTREALNEGKIANHLRVARDGQEAWELLEEAKGTPWPDLILLDLNMPRMDGRELLARMDGDPELRRIPVVVLTTSKAEEDIIKSYELAANCYITKPVDLDQFLAVVQQVESFWLTVVRLPTQPVSRE